MTAAIPTAKPALHWEDPPLLNDQLAEDERMMRDSAHAFRQSNARQI